MNADRERTKKALRWVFFGGISIFAFYATVASAVSLFHEEDPLGGEAFFFARVMFFQVGILFGFAFLQLAVNSESRTSRAEKYFVAAFVLNLLVMGVGSTFDIALMKAHHPELWGVHNDQRAYQLAALVTSDGFHSFVFLYIILMNFFIFAFFQFESVNVHVRDLKIGFLMVWLFLGVVVWNDIGWLAMKMLRW